MFAILFEGLLIEIQLEIHHFTVLGRGGLRGTKIVNKHFVNKLAFPIIGPVNFGDGPNTVSESAVSNTELSEFFGAHRVPGRENSVSSSQPFVCVTKRTHRVFSQNSPSLPQNSVRPSEFSSPKQYFRNSILPVS